MPEERTSNGSLVPVSAIAGEVTRQEFGVQQIEKRAETASTAVAAREQAAVNALFIMAERHPRNIERFRLAMLDECKRPTFSAVARYGKPVGKEKDRDTGEWVEKKVHGPSIRFIESAIRNFRNLSPEVFTVFDSPDLRIVRVTVTDLESVIRYASEIQVEKHVERRGQKKGNTTVAPEGRDVVGERVNTYGDKVFIVRATEDEVLVKQNALVSKAIRTQAQRLLPGDIVEECMRMVVTVQEAADKSDPEASMRKILDAFHDLNVEPTDLEAWAGKPLDRLQPKQMQELREIYAAIRDGELDWDQVMANVTTGSTDDQKKAQADKLNALRKPPSNQPTTDAKAGHKTTADAQSEAATKGPASSATGTADAPAPEKKEPEIPRHILDLRAWRETLGGTEFTEVMKVFGHASINEVPVEAFPELQQGLMERAEALNKTKVDTPAAQPATKKLRFGDPKK